MFVDIFSFLSIIFFVSNLYLHKKSLFLLLFPFICSRNCSQFMNTYNAIAQRFYKRINKFLLEYSGKTVVIGLGSLYFFCAYFFFFLYLFLFIRLVALKEREFEETAAIWQNRKTKESRDNRGMLWIGEEGSKNTNKGRKWRNTKTGERSRKWRTGTEIVVLFKQENKKKIRENHQFRLYYYQSWEHLRK